MVFCNVAETNEEHTTRPLLPVAPERGKMPLLNLQHGTWEAQGFPIGRVALCMQ